MIYYLGEIALSADQTKIGHSYQTGRINLALLQLTQKGPDTEAPDLFQKSKRFNWTDTEWKPHIILHAILLAKCIHSNKHDR